jgi:hypothetical protein
MHYESTNLFGLYPSHGSAILCQQIYPVLMDVLADIVRDEMINARCCTNTMCFLEILKYWQCMDL